MSKKIKEFIVAIDLPLPPSMSGVASADAQKNTKFRKQLSKKIGHPIKLVGAGRANPYYAVVTSFSARPAAKKLADLVSAEVAAALKSGDLIYNYTPPEVTAGKAGWIISWDEDGTFW